VLYSLAALGIVLFLVQGRGQRASKQMTYLLLLLAIAISILIETIYVRDFLDNSDWERMNTVFKFLEQVWVLYALGSALAVFEMVRWLWHARLRARQQEFQAELLQVKDDDAAETGDMPRQPASIWGTWGRNMRRAFLSAYQV